MSSLLSSNTDSSNSSGYKQLNTPKYGKITTTSTSGTSVTGSAITITPVTNVPTDIWRKPGPPLVETFNAPILYKRVKVGEFLRVGVKVGSIFPSYGGLILNFWGLFHCKKCLSRSVLRWFCEIDCLGF